MALIAAAALGAAADWTRPPPRQATVRLLLAGVAAYQRGVSPWLARGGVRCRFEPTCSHYAAAVIARDGAPLGAWRAALRVLRCGPWTPPGTVDRP